MTDSLFPLRFLLLLFAGFVNREQAKAIEYLREENRVLRELLGKWRLRGGTRKPRHQESVRRVGEPVV